MLKLAENKNVAIKITGACTLSHEKFPYKDIWDPLGRIFDAYGLDRCMWGTDWTRAVNLLTYKEGVELLPCHRPPERQRPRDPDGRQPAEDLRLVAEEGLTRMPVIDAQVHCYGRNTPDSPWADPFPGPAEMTGEDMVKAMDDVGVDGALLTSVFAIYRFDAS